MKIRKKLLKVSKCNIVLFLLFTPFLEPKCFEQINMLDKLYTCALFAVMAWGLIHCISRRRKPSNIVLAMFLLEASMFVTTVLNVGETRTAFFRLIRYTAMALLIDCYSQRIKNVIKVLLLHFEICIYINLITILLFPDGLYQIYNEAYRTYAKFFFLGWNHIYVVWELPALLVAWVYKTYNPDTKRQLVLSVAVIATELFFGSSTALVACALFLFLIYAPLVRRFLTPIRAVLISLGIVVGIVYFRAFEIFEPFIVGVLGKDMTFTGRLTIWDSMIDFFTKNFLFGYGVMNSNTFSSIVGFAAASHAHNQVLQIAVQGGLIALGFYAWLYILNIRALKENWNCTWSKICVYSIFSYTIIGITEPFEYSLMYMILVIPYYCCFIKLNDDESMCWIEKNKWKIKNSDNP